MSSSKDIMILDMSKPDPPKQSAEEEPQTFSKNATLFEGFDSIEKLYLQGHHKEDVSFTNEMGLGGTEHKGNNLMERCTSS